MRTPIGTGSAALRDVSAHLRSFPHVLCAPGQYLVGLPSVTALVDESRTMVRVHVTVDNEDAVARACAALTRELQGHDVEVIWSRPEAKAVAQLD